jgi:hypothetical protein
MRRTWLIGQVPRASRLLSRGTADFGDFQVFLNPARTGRPNLLSKERPEAKLGELDRLQNARPSLDLPFGP